MTAAACGALILSVLAAAPAHAAVASRNSSYVYDSARGLLIKEIVEPNDSNLCVVKEYAYDAYGNRTSTTTRNCNGGTGEAPAPATGSAAVIAARTSTASYVYNADGSVSVTLANALGHTESRLYDPAFGNVTSLTGPNNLTTTWAYDTFGRKALETRADGTTTTTTYGQPCGVSDPDLAYAVFCVSEQSSGESNPNYTYYDALNRKLATIRIDFTNTQWITDGRVDYDSLGQVSNRYRSYPVGGAASAKHETLSYDVTGRVVSGVAPDGGASYVTYNGLSTIDQNALNQTKTTVRNVVGQIVSITDVQNKTITYTYDPFGDLLTTTDALGNVTTLAYDAMGRKIAMADPDMGNWQYQHDVLGELVTQVDAKNQTVTLTYDVLGRVLTKSEPDLISTWTYDTAANGKGKLASTTSNNGYSRSFTYDSLGRVTSISSVIDNPASPYVEATTYDTYGRVSRQTYPDGFAVARVYNTAGYLAQVVNAATPTTVYWTANAVDAAGDVTQQTYGNGIVWTQVFDPATGRVTQQQAGANNAVQNMSYNYDSLGNLLTRSDVNAGLSENFIYDSLNRVTAATATGATGSTLTSFAYDDIGNITSKSDVGSYAYNASGANSVRPHAVASITGSVYGVTNPAYTYDANGNMTAGAGRSVIWTSFNMPSQMTGCPNGGTTCSTVGFWYNSDHERIKELQADQSVVITLSPRYDIGLHFEKKYIAANGVLTGAVEYEHYLYSGSGQMFGNYIVTTQTDGVTVASTSTEYYVKDHLGSIVARLDGTGAVIERLSYDVFGKRRNPDGSAATIVNPDMYHGFTGQEMLDAVGLVHLNGRVYDPITGRFTSADPTVQAPLDMQSFNRYSYVLNNPLALTDPSGYFSIGHLWHDLTGAATGPLWKVARALQPVASFVGRMQNSQDHYLGHYWHDLTGTDWSQSRDQYVKPIVAMVIAYYTGYYVEGATGSYVAAGAASGAAGSGATEAFNGGNGSQVLTAAFYGGVSGAISGGIEGGLAGYGGFDVSYSWGPWSDTKNVAYGWLISKGVGFITNGLLQACWQQNDCPGAGQIFAAGLYGGVAGGVVGLGYEPLGLVSAWGIAGNQTISGIAKKAATNAYWPAVLTVDALGISLF